MTMEMKVNTLLVMLVVPEHLLMHAGGSTDHVPLARHSALGSPAMM